MKGNVDVSSIQGSTPSVDAVKQPSGEDLSKGSSVDSVAQNKEADKSQNQEKDQTQDKDKDEKDKKERPQADQGGNKGEGKESSNKGKIAAVLQELLLS